VYGKEARIGAQLNQRQDELTKEREKVLSRKTEPNFSSANSSVASIPSVEAANPVPSLSESNPVTILCRPTLCQSSNSGSRDKQEEKTIYSVDKSCGCGKSCLKQLKTSKKHTHTLIISKQFTIVTSYPLNHKTQNPSKKGEHNYDKAAEVPSPLRADIHMGGLSTKFEQKEALK